MELRNSESKGVYVVATSRFSPGDIILEEDPLVVNSYSEAVTQQIEELCAKNKLQSNFLYRAITTCSQPSDVCQRVLTLYCPVQSHYTTPEAQARYHRILSCVNEAASLGLLPSGVDLDTFIKFVFIWDVNSVRLDQSFEHKPGCSALFERFSRLCHSCFPNAVHFSKNRRQFVRCLRPIQEGDEITISYQSDGSALCSAMERNRDLLLAEGFVCGCIRCKHDYCRMFCCRQCDGAVLVSQLEGARGFEWEDVELTCTQCHYEFTPEQKKFAFEREEFLKHAVQDEHWITDLWDRMFEGEDVRGEVKDAMIQCREVLDEQHWVFQKLLELSREMDDFLNEHTAALEVGRRLIAYSKKAVGDISFTEAMQHERLGNALEALRRFAEAKEEYAEARRIYGLMLPAGHDFISHADELVLKMDKQLLGQTARRCCPFCGNA